MAIGCRCIVPVASDAYPVLSAVGFEVFRMAIWEYNSYHTELYIFL
jgi:hypothetical protein